jgi:hypothetical protein
VQAAVYLGGKCSGRQDELNVLGTGSGPLIYLFDAFSNRNFLVDTGASCSMVPFHSSSLPSGPRLYSADGSPVDTWGSKELQLFFSGHQFRYSFLLAAVDKPILGADFLAQFRLLVDPYNKAVLFVSTLAPIVAPGPLKIHLCLLLYN